MLPFPGLDCLCCFLGLLVQDFVCVCGAECQSLDIFENPYGVPQTNKSQTPPPNHNKKKSKTPKSSRIPRSKRYFPKSKRDRSKSNVLSRTVNVRYFQGILEELKVFEIFCWGITVRGVREYLSQSHCSRKGMSMPNMTGRPGYRTMEMNGGSSAPYLARTPYVPLFSTLFNRGGNSRAFRLPGAGGGSFPLYGGTYAGHIRCREWRTGALTLTRMWHKRREDD